MSLLISKVFTYDVDAGNYIQAVEAADAQALEPATRQAINNFVIGCKQDGIWTAIKASCILAGARTLAGALVPLVGTAPTNNGPFVSGDYNRKTGLVGDGSTKSLNSNRNNNVNPQNNRHVTVYVSSAGASTNWKIYIGGTTDGPGSLLLVNSISNNILYPSMLDGTTTQAGLGRATSFLGMSRDSSSAYVLRANSLNRSIVRPSSAPLDQPIGILSAGSGFSHSDARLAFYSIGESLDLALLDARVTALINAFAAAIP
jgi:hypothetical protein